MRQFKIFAFLILQFSTIYGQVYIKGKVKGENINSIKIYTPILNLYNLNNEAGCINVKIDSTQSFAQKITTTQNYGFLTLKISNRNIYIVFENKDSIDIAIDLTDMKDYQNWLQFKGSNANGHLLLNKYLITPFLNFAEIDDYFSNFSKYKNVSPLSFLDLDLKRKTKFLDSLYQQKLISQVYQDLAKVTIKNILSNEFLKPFLRSSKFQSNYTKKEINKIIDSIHNLTPLDTKTLVAYIGRVYYESFLLQKEKVKKNYLTISDIKDSTIVFNDVKYNISNSFVPYLFIDDNVQQEYIWGTMLHGIANMFADAQKKGDIDYFKAKYPNSIFLPEVVRSFDEINNLTPNNFNNKNIILDTILKFNSFKDIIAFIKPENLVYIDLWATWCIPCKQEFRYYQDLDSFFFNKQIKKVFISLDNRKMMNTWIRNVYLYKLSGLNIIANDELTDEILRKVYNSKTYSVPRYLVLNRNGEIVNTDFSRPSDPSIKFDLEQVLKLIKD